MIIDCTVMIDCTVSRVDPPQALPVVLTGADSSKVACLRRTESSSVVAVSG